MEDTPWYEAIAVPALLRHARTTYGAAMRLALETEGFDDIPPNGLYVIGSLAFGENGVPISHVVKDLGITKQGAGQLIDTLVLRGYLSRTPDDLDRRQLIVSLTDRGRAAANAQTRGRIEVDSKLVACIGSDDMQRLRRSLAVLIDIGRQDAEPPSPTSKGAN